MDTKAVSGHPWLGDHVWPHLPLRDTHPGSNAAPGPFIMAGRCKCQPKDGLLNLSSTLVKPKWVIANEVREFLLTDPNTGAVQAPAHTVELWADCGAYDHVALAQLWGSMVKMPKGLPYFTCDVRQEMLRLGVDDGDLPPQQGPAHNALADARYVRQIHQHLASLVVAQ